MATRAASTGERQPLLSQARPSDVDEVNGDGRGLYHSADARDEQSQPLLGNGQAHQAEETGQADRPPATPLPKLQIFIVCIMRLSEPMSFLFIFPFINEQLHDALPDVPVAELGYYVGLIESCFAIIQVCTVLFWGRLSDRIGRRPVLLIGMAGTVVSVNAFGLAKSFPAMIAARCISGLFNANVSVLKSVLGELTDSTNNARAFSLLPIMYGCGAIIGPWLGGSFSHPVESFPSIFGGSSFLAKYPYYLPCGMSSLYILFAMVIGFLYLEETLPSKRRQHKVHALRQEAETTDGQTARQDTEEADAIEQTTEESKPPSVRSLLTTQVLSIITTQTFLNLQNICFTSLLPLFCFEQVKYGGVGFERSDIGHLLATNGVLAIITQAVLFPWTEKRLGGPLNVYRVALLLYLPSFLVFPVAHVVAEHFGYKATWMTFAVGIAFKAMSGMSIVCATLLVNNVAPSRNSLGALNGLSQTFGSLSRAVGPTMSTSLFAFSTTHKGFGQLVWAVMIAIATTAWLLSFRIARSANRPAWADR
ncbi:MFS general substrate transporter [Microstroma glucosiphilum]|uniref:MFS general substrate transporter n=1 Tax=Pseudomicrostroma glucosiphilum TaxID=1684307 RepID=A0A316UEA5_9BASI|nr:MFS general substrate transporter [Pseudomicrostroma glucosiphilum]PWN21435.1 MFS general substrate transporter [Pseudomicrostroma glucosiphilum]